MKTRMATIVCGVAAMLSLGTVTAYATETTGAEATASYSYLSGQQRSQNRNDLYAQAAEIESEEERDAFLAEHGIQETAWSAEAAAKYTYVAGRLRGVSYASDDEEPDVSSYSYVTGQNRGPSYHR